VRYYALANLRGKEKDDGTAGDGYGQRGGEADHYGAYGGGGYGSDDGR
jgi:hypothetical protein